MSNLEQRIARLEAQAEGSAAEPTFIILEYAGQVADPAAREAQIAAALAAQPGRQFVIVDSRDEAAPLHPIPAPEASP